MTNKFPLSAVVRIEPLENIPGLVLSITQDAGGLWYKVRYFINGEAKEVFFLEHELVKP